MPRRAAFIARSPDGTAESVAGSPAIERAMDRPELLDEAIRLYQPRAPRPLSREDAREIVSNIAGFFSVVSAWDRRARKAQQVAAAAVEDKP